MDAPPTTEQELKHAAEGLVESNEHTHVAAENAENEGEKDGANADSAAVTREVAENSGHMLSETDNAIKAITMGLQALQGLHPQLAYMNGLAKTVADKTPPPAPHPVEGPPEYNGRRFGARQPSLLRRLNQQSTYAAPQRSRLQYRGLARR